MTDEDDEKAIPRLASLLMSVVGAVLFFAILGGTSSINTDDNSDSYDTYGSSDDSSDSGDDVLFTSECGMSVVCVAKNTT